MGGGEGIPQMIFGFAEIFAAAQGIWGLLV